MSISTPFIRRPIATTLLMVAMVLVGAIAYPLLPVAPLPQVDFPTIQVSASLPGASPETMASSVATPLERQFSQIAGVTQMTSSSALGVASITIQFDLARNIDAAAQDVQSAITAASGQLPKNLPSPPTFRKVNPADSPILIIAVQSQLYPITKVDDLADTILAQQISQIPGIAQVAITGEQKPAVRVQVDPAKLAALGMSLEDVRGVLAAATVDSPKGSFDGPTQSFTIYADDQLLASQPWNDVIIAYKNGAPVRIRDIGAAVDAPENMRLASWQKGKRGIQLIVFKQPGANVIETVDRVRAMIPRLEASLPPGISVDILTDRTQTIRASVEDVQLTMLLTIALVVAVIFAFLRNVWATIIPSITVPMALIGTFAVMYVLGYSLDNLSLMGLTIAVGFVVDDAIVMLENIHRHIEEGLSPMDAALKGAGEIGFTIISISLSLIAVFIPVLLMGGIVGRLLREFAVTVTITILVSVVVSLTLTPMMCSLFLKSEHGVKHGRVYMASEAFFDGMLRGYDRGLKWVLRHQTLALMSLFVTLAATIALYVAIPKGFFPQQDTGFLTGFTEAAQDISFAAMSQKQQALMAIVAKDPDVESVAGSVGATGGSQTINTGRMWINLKPRDERGASADQIINRLRPQVAKVPGALLFLQASQDINVGGRPARTQYQYTLQDANLAELNEWAPKILAKLRSIPGLQDVATDQQTNAPTVSLAIDRDTAARFGIQPQVIDDTLYDAFGQRQVAQYFTQLSQYHVVLEVDPKLQLDASSLDKIYVKSPRTSEMIPLSAFVKVDTSKTAYLSISHQGQFPAVTLSFNLAPGTALGQAVTAIRQAEQEMGKPVTLIGNFQGTAQAFQDSLRTQPYLIAAALVAVYIILGVLYESFIHPLTILSTLPSAGLGALLTLYVAGFDLSVMGIIGILLLIGIVKKNGIMMIDFALQREREEGMAPEQSIYEACLTRFRPIMMTTMAALLGGLPLMLGTGTGSELRQPLGFAIVGGLIVSQILTLYTTPVVYLAMHRLTTRLARWRRKTIAAHDPPADTAVVQLERPTAAE
ncbi:multidrug efflux RND transporter permease subunit [Azorhizobium sp. AG788]|uniref:multidrug efflux RND transporter permease subunit n=1 Tax=Azorhizobium sp. AG788 TaxID=2183897 RepID=UPI003138D652